VHVVDDVKYFVIYETCKVCDDLINWVYYTATIVWFTIVLGKYDNGSERRKPFSVLNCEKGGVYKRTKKDLKKEDTINEMWMAI